MGQAEPAGIVAMPSPVTPRRDKPHPTVLDPWVPTDHPAALSGDVCGTDEIPMPSVSKVRAAERPPLRLGDPPPAQRTRRRGPSLVHLDDPDARRVRLVLQGPDEMRAPPVAQPQVLAPAGIPVADALGVAHPKGPDLVADRPGDHGLGCLVVGVMDPARWRASW